MTMIQFTESLRWLDWVLFEAYLCCLIAKCIAAKTLIPKKISQQVQGQIQVSFDVKIIKIGAINNFVVTALRFYTHEIFRQNRGVYKTAFLVSYNPDQVLHSYYFSKISMRAFSNKTRLNFCAPKKSIIPSIQFTWPKILLK